MIKKYLMFFILIMLLVFTYNRFQEYEPKILKQLQEVKGITTQTNVLPYPTGSIEISKTENTQIKHITLKVPEDYLKVRSFYTNILLEKGWKIESEEKNEVFHILKLKKKNEVTTITSTLEKEDGYTIVSLKILKNN